MTTLRRPLEEVIAEINRRVLIKRNTPMAPLHMKAENVGFLKGLLWLLEPEERAEREKKALQESSSESIGDLPLVRFPKQKPANGNTEAQAQ